MIIVPFFCIHLANGEVHGKNVTIQSNACLRVIFIDSIACAARFKTFLKKGSLQPILHERCLNFNKIKKNTISTLASKFDIFNYFEFFSYYSWKVIKIASMCVWNFAAAVFDIVLVHRRKPIATFMNSSYSSTCTYFSWIYFSTIIHLLEYLRYHNFHMIS